MLTLRVFFISAGLWMCVGDKNGLVAIRCDGEMGFASSFRNEEHYEIVN